MNESLLQRAQLGDLHAQYDLGLDYLSSSTDKKRSAEQLFRRCEETAWCAEAGFAYDQLRENATREREEAVNWLKKAAAQGHLAAQDKLKELGYRG